MSEAAKQARREYSRNHHANASIEAIEARKKYSREWRQKNPDKVRKHTVDYWERKASGMNIQTLTEVQRSVEITSHKPISELQKYESIIPELESQVKELKKQGLSLREIGTRLSISHMKVSRILKDCNSL